MEVNDSPVRYTRKGTGCCNYTSGVEMGISAGPTCHREVRKDVPPEICTAKKIGLCWLLDLVFLVACFRYLQCTSYRTKVFYS